MEDLQAARSLLERLQTDWENFCKRVRKSADGTVINAIKLAGLKDNATLKEIGAQLNNISGRARTGGDYEEIGSLYGFRLSVKTELSEKSHSLERDNRFFISGEGNLKYTHNNGVMAGDPERASSSFLSALKKIPGLIETEENKVSALQKDEMVLQEIVSGEWKKGRSLEELRTQLAALERKILLSLDEGKERAKETEENVSKAETSERLLQIKPKMNRR